MDKKLITENKNPKQTVKSSNLKFLDIYLEKLKSHDEMEVLQFLQELSKELLISNDQIAEEVNCQYLIKSLIDLLDNFQHIPEIALNSIVCLNAFLDLNPLFTTTIVKNGGIPKIVMMTQNIEYIDIAENAIKTIEKISTENTLVLLENEALMNILNLIDFFELSLRKTAIKACVNITKSLNSYDNIKKYIIPIIPTLSNLIKLNGNTEIEKFILDKCILCFYNIIHSIRVHNFSKYDSQLYNSLVYHGILNNFFDIISSFLRNLNNEGKTQNKNTNIHIDTFKNIIKIFEILCSQSNDITNIVLNMNILEIIHNMMMKEFDPLNKDKFNSSNLPIFPEIFSLLISLFPLYSHIKSEKDIKDHFRSKIMSVENKVFYIYFCEKLMPLLLNNILSLPSSTAMLNVIRLIELFIIFSTKENIVKYIWPAKLSNVLSKLLDSKDTIYIHKVLFLVENLMASCPESVLESFIREGVVDNIRVVNEYEESAFYSSENIEKSNTYVNYAKYNKYYNQSHYEKDFYNNQFLYKDYKMNRENWAYDETSNEDKENKNTINLPDTKKIITLAGSGSIHKIPKLEPTNNIEISKEKKEVVIKESETCKKKDQESIVGLIKTKCRYLIAKYFSDNSKIDEYLKIGKCFMSPQLFLNQLCYSASLLRNENVSEIDLTQIFNILINNSKNMTFYEIEKSMILLNLCGHIDETFMENYEKSNNKNAKLSITPSDKFLERIYRMFCILSNNINSINELINILQNCISSMNCFKLFLSESDNLYMNSTYSISLNKNKNNLKLKVNFQYNKNEKIKEDENIEQFIKDLHLYYSVQKNVTLYVEPLDTFSSIEKILISKSQDLVNSELVKTRPKLEEKHIDDIELDDNIIEEIKQEKTSQESFEDQNEMGLKKYVTSFYVMINNEKLTIDLNLTIDEFIKEVKKLISEEEFNQNRETHIFFEFASQKDIKQTKSIKMSSSDEMDIDSELFDSKLNCLYSIQEKLFLMNYSKTILANKSLYNIKRLSPFLYLLSLFEMSVNTFSDLFFTNTIQRLNENILHNHKVSSLLFKQSRDYNAISASMIPSWCKDICQNLTYLASFSSRYLYFKTCSFDVKRSILNLSNYTKNFNGEGNVDDKTFTNLIKRRKYKVSRDNILLYAEKIYNDVGNSDCFLDIEYIDETGTGNGPTLEFYSLFAKEIREKFLWFRTSHLSLYPLPVEQGQVRDDQKRYFFLLGYYIARGLYDDRLLDIPLNSLFWDVVLGRPISLQKISNLDKDLGKILSELSKLLKLKESLINNNRHIDLEELLLYNNKKISEMDCYFNLPGTNIELKPKGSEILLTANNLHEFIELIYDSFCGNGIKEYVKVFKAGFNKIFDINILKCFKSTELEEILSGSENEHWDCQTLTQFIIPNHGYDKNSLIYKYLINILSEMNSSERKRFLFFVTGCPRLPLGGFKSLHPKLTVVKKNPDQPLEVPDNYLPTVMTCQNYLKIPEYSNCEIFRKKLNIAMTEGFNTFHFS